jgi:hypothetical protein
MFYAITGVVVCVFVAYLLRDKREYASEIFLLLALIDILWIVSIISSEIVHGH